MGGWGILSVRPSAHARYEVPLGRHRAQHGNETPDAWSHILVSQQHSVPLLVEAMMVPTTQRRSPDPVEDIRRRLQKCERCLAKCEAHRRLDWTYGISQQTAEVARDVLTAAEADASLLILGLTGVGKEMVVLLIACLTCLRRGRTCTVEPVNCPAIAGPLMESELFGHKRGAFTGATSDFDGACRRAGDGILFLDEVLEIPFNLQAKLLRALEARMFKPLGGSKEVPLKARIVAATNQDIDKAVEDEQFRRDLFYRLNVLRIHLPALEERREDIPYLAQHHLDRMGEAKGIAQFSTEAMQWLLSYQWPGNIRELRNTVERAVALCHEAVIRAEHLPSEIIAGHHNIVRADDKSVSPLAVKLAVGPALRFLFVCALMARYEGRASKRQICSLYTTDPRLGCDKTAGRDIDKWLDLNLITPASDFEDPDLFELTPACEFLLHAAARCDAIREIASLGLSRSA